MMAWEQTNVKTLSRAGGVRVISHENVYSTEQKEQRVPCIAAKPERDEIKVAAPQR
jgi:hypothetical protein